MVNTILLGLKSLLYRLKKKYDTVHRMIFFNAFLRSIQKGYLNFSIAVMISLQNVS